MAKNSELTKMARELYSAMYKAGRYLNYSEDDADQTAVNLVYSTLGSDALTITEAISAKVVAESARPKITAPPPQPVDIREGMRDLANSLGFNEYETQIFAGTEIKESGNETDKAKLAQSQSQAESQLEEIINRLVG
jgi:hypothetical protein